MWSSADVCLTTLEAYSFSIRGKGEGGMEILKRVGTCSLCLLIAGAALSNASYAWYQLAVTGKLPIHARHGDGTLAPFTISYFVVSAFYAVAIVIGLGAIVMLIDQCIGIPIIEKVQPRLRRRVAAWIAAISFVVPIA